MFAIIQLDMGRFVIQNFVGGFVSEDGVIQTFSSRKKARKHINKLYRRLDESMTRLRKSYPNVQA